MSSPSPGAATGHQTVLVLDYGSQYTQLIARRVRELGVFCEIHGPELSPEEIAGRAPIGIILSGGPQSIYADGAVGAPRTLFELGIPVLGVCYGMQLMADRLGGQVAAASEREYGRAEIRVERPGILFAGLATEQVVWMSHGDRVEAVPPGFAITASSANAPIVAMEDAGRRLLAIQFHPEVVHTAHGVAMLEHFLREACGALGDWRMASYREEARERIRATVEEGNVLCAISGGVDSAVVAALLHEAVGDRMTAVFVDNGLLRRGEADQVLDSLGRGLGIPIRAINAGERFLGELDGVADPEQKRKTIGRVFIEVFEDVAQELEDVRYLAQGTLYPDVIESVSQKGPAALIKTHHNVGGLPERLGFRLIEPLRMLFKDEVRRLGRELGLPAELLERHPFPGPGLGVRILGPVDAGRVATLQAADAIYLEELRAAGWYGRTAQAFAVLLPVRSVGVMGDFRTYEEVIALRAVETVDFMTADWVALPPELLGRVAGRIVNEVAGVNRVVYDVTSKPPGTIEWE